MRTRDWAGTVLVTCLIALASQLSSHRILVGLLFGAASMSGVLIVRDVRSDRKGPDGPTASGVITAGRSVRAGAEIEAAGDIRAGESIEAGGAIRARVGAPGTPDGERSRRRRVRRPDRFLLIGALLSLAVAIAAPLALFPSNAPSTHAAVAGQQPELDVTGSLLAYDGVAEKRWATDITAALTDPLSFHLTLRNHSSTATPLLDVEPFYVEPSDPDGLPWTVWVAIGPPDSETTLPGAYAQITPQENGLGFINFDPSSFRGQRLGQTGSVQLYAAPSARSDFQSPTGQVRASTAAVLGSLAPHETQLVTFTAQSSGSDGHILPDPYAGGSVIRFRTSPTSQFHQFGAASSGETLLFRIMVDTPDGTPLAPVLRVAVSPHDAQHSVSLTAFASVPYGPPQKLAAAVVSAAGTSMISLSPVPGSTRLRGYRGDTCTHIEDLGALPDGITEGGIEIGQVGGFHPRDPCKGDEFIRWVQFTMHVGGAE